MNNLIQIISFKFAICCVSVIFLITGSINVYAIKVSILPVGFDKLDSIKEGDYTIYKLSLDQLSQGLIYQLKIDKKVYSFSLPNNPAYTGKNFVIYVPVPNDILDKSYTLEENDRVISEKKLPSNTNKAIKKYHITQIALEKLNEPPRIVNNIFEQDYLLRIQAKIGTHLYWISPEGPDWGWLYKYVYFRINSNTMSDILITNTLAKTQKSKFSFLEEEVVPDGKIFTLRTTAMQDISVNAIVDIFDYYGDVALLSSGFTAPISFEPLKPEVSQDELVEQPTPMSYVVPIYLNIDKLCRYSNSFINAQLNLIYLLQLGHDFEFMTNYMDTNIFDNRMEIFTSAFPFGEKLFIGQLTLSNLKVLPIDAMEMQVHFVKNNTLDAEDIDIDAKDEIKPEVIVRVKDSIQDFDLSGLKCQIEDSNFRIEINCYCGDVGNYN